MKKRYLLFSFILVAFVLTAQSTWAYFKDSREVKTAFSASVTTGSPKLTISNQTYNLERGKEEDITKTITFERKTSLPWDQNTVHLEFSTPNCTVDGRSIELANLFDTYYTRTIEKVSVNEDKAVFKVTVKYSKDISQDIQLRLGVENILFNVKGVASSADGKSITTDWDWLKIITLPWNWPDNQRFSYTHIRDWTTYGQYGPIINASEYHTPMYYGPSAINGEVTPHSKNVFPSLRFVNDNVTQLMNGSQLNYSAQLTVAKQKYPYEISYVDEDDNYSLVRGPVYFVPGKGFVSAYYMTWTGEVNDYGARPNWGSDGNKIFKRLYMYNGNYYYLVESNRDYYYSEYWRKLVYTYQLYPVDSMILSYVNSTDSEDKFRFVIQNGNTLTANYNDYNGQFRTGQIVYDPQYGESNLGNRYYRIVLNGQEVKQNYK